MRTPPVGAGSSGPSGASRRTSRRRRARSMASAAASASLTITFRVSQHRWPLRSSDSSGSTISAGGSEDHGGDAPPSGAKANPPVQTGPAPAGRPGGASIAASRSSSEQSRATSPKRSGPRETTSWALPRAPSAKPSRSGCSQQNQRSEASLDASTAPLTSVESTATVALASVRRPRAPASSIAMETASSRPSVASVIRKPSCRAWPAGSRPRPCAPSPSARAGGSCARRPRSCRRCR